MGAVEVRERSLTGVAHILRRVKPSRPKMATVVLAVALMVVGVALFFFQAQAVEFVRGIGALPNDLQRQIVDLMTERVAAYAALAASPILLIIGSLATEHLKMRQQAPRGITIAVAAVLVVVGIVGTFLALIPAVAGINGETIGVVAYLAATVVMLAGIFIRGL